MGSENWRELKTTMEQQIGTLEPFTESIPSMYIIVVVGLYESFVKNNKAWTKEVEGAGSLGHVLYISAIVSSMFAATFGMIKFFKSGPTRFLPKVGMLDGLITWKTLLAFFSVLLLNIVKIAFLLFLVKNRSAERWFYQVAGGEKCPQITWVYHKYTSQEEVYNVTHIFSSMDVFQRVTFGKEPSRKLNQFLIMKKPSKGWSSSNNQSCIDQIDFVTQEKSLPACFQTLKPQDFPLCGIWHQKASMTPNFMLWSSFFVLPHFFLSLFVLIWASRACSIQGSIRESACFCIVRVGFKTLLPLLLQHPQILITPVFSHFFFGPKNPSLRSKLEISPYLSWTNALLHLICLGITVFCFQRNQMDDLPGVHKDHKITAACVVLFTATSISFVGLVLHLPALKTEVC